MRDNSVIAKYWKKSRSQKESKWIENTPRRPNNNLKVEARYTMTHMAPSEIHNDPHGTKHALTKENKIRHGKCTKNGCL